MPTKLTPYQDRVVAFIDILGFAALVSSITAQPKLQVQLHSALTYIKSYKTSSLMGDTANSNLEVSVFSDSIVISAEQSNVFRVIWASGWLQAYLLGEGILTRGGISIGKTVHVDDILYGEGMLKAHKIESSAAIYPRIVVDPCLLNRIKDGVKSTFLLEYFDGLWFVDSYGFCCGVGGADELVADGYDPHEIYLENLGRHIEKGIELASQVDHIAKWKWISLRHKSSTEDYLRTRETKMDKMMRLAEQKKMKRTQKAAPLIGLSIGNNICQPSSE